MTNLIIACSTVDDSSMKVANPQDFTEITTHRQQFLAHYNIPIDRTVLVALTYTGDNYRRYFVVDVSDCGDGMTRPTDREADALLTTTKGLGLFLPLADCTGAVLYDPVKGCLMVSHLGRHNLEQQGAEMSVRYMVDRCGSNPADIDVWLSPAAGGENYPLFAFNNHSMHDVAIEQFRRAGIDAKNIVASPIDTTTDENYFSHSQFLKGNRDSDGRFAIVAMMQN